MQIEVPYTEAIKRKYPEPVTIAIAKDPQGKYNPITLGWVMSTSHVPPMLAISIGKARYSLEAIRQAKAFVVSFPSAEQLEESLVHGTRSGRDCDKLALAGTAIQPAQKIDGVLMAEAEANFECVLEGELETGDHVIFAGRIVASYVSDSPAKGRLYTLGNEQLGGIRPA